MSSSFQTYSYVFKFIIVGDSSKLFRTISFDYNQRCWQIMPTAAIYRQEIQSDSRSDDRS